MAINLDPNAQAQHQLLPQPSTITPFHFLATIDVREAVAQEQNWRGIVSARQFAALEDLDDLDGLRREQSAGRLEFPEFSAGLHSSLLVVCES